MRALAIIILAVLACAEPPYSITVPTTEPEWLNPVAERAVGFWGEHGGEFTITSDALLQVISHPLKEDRLGECDCNHAFYGER